TGLATSMVKSIAPPWCTGEGSLSGRRWKRNPLRHQGVAIGLGKMVDCWHGGDPLPALPRGAPPRGAPPRGAPPTASRPESVGQSAVSVRLLSAQIHASAHA